MKTCQLMVGYKDKDESFLDSEGYFHTGDLGYYDKDGVIHFIEKVIIKSESFLYLGFRFKTLHDDSFNN